MLFGLGKKRTTFGKKLDKAGIDQIELERASSLSRRTVSRLCNDDSYIPRIPTEQKVKKALKQLGVNNPDDFFPM